MTLTSKGDVFPDPLLVFCGPPRRPPRWLAEGGSSRSRYFSSEELQEEEEEEEREWAVCEAGSLDEP